MRPRYRRRRDILLGALAQLLPDFQATGISAGLHVVTWLPADLAETAVIEAAAARGLGVYGLRPYRLGPGRDALLFGYGNVNDAAIRDGIELLAETVATIRSRQPAATDRRDFPTPAGEEPVGPA